MWVVGGVMALTGALTYSELSGMMPRSGGLYVFLAEAYGGLLGFLYGWVCFLVVNTGSYAALAMAFAALSITLIYILTNVAYLSLMTPAEIAGSERVAADAVKRVIGPIGGGLIALAIFISTSGEPSRT